MNESENNMVSEKPTQSMIEKAVEEFTAKGGEIKKINPKPVNRKQKREAGKADRLTAKKIRKQGTGSRSGLTAWSQIKVSIGSVLKWTNDENLAYLVSCSDVSMECELFVKNKQGKFVKQVIPSGNQNKCFGSGSKFRGISPAEAWMKTKVLKTKSFADLKRNKSGNTTCSQFTGWNWNCEKFQGKPEPIRSRYHRLVKP